MPAWAKVEPFVPKMPPHAIRLYCPIRPPSPVMYAAQLMMSDCVFDFVFVRFDSISCFSRTRFYQFLFLKKKKWSGRLTYLTTREGEVSGGKSEIDIFLYLVCVELV